MSAKMSMTTKVMIWMVAGILVGLLINSYLQEVDFVQDYIVNGLFAVVGKIFINLLKMLVVPLVTFSLICGVCGLGDVTKLGRVGLKALGLFLLTTALAITMAVAVGNMIGPGEGFDLSSQAASEYTPPEPTPLTDVLIGLVPSNPVAAFADGNMLQIIFYTILLGLCILMVGERGKPLIDLSERLNEVMMQLVTVVMHLAPYGVFALIAKVIAIEGISAFESMLEYSAVLILVLALHLFVTLMLLLKVLARVNIFMFLKKMRTAQLFAFSTASSNATIPVTLRSVEKRLGVDNPTASFIVPFGATINMDGTAIMQGVATVFIANAYGIELGLAGYVTVILMAVLASVGTAGIPSAGTVMLAMVLAQVGLPVEGIALILGIDRILDMIRTAVNVTGDAAITTIIARSENSIDMDVFNDPEAGTVEEIHMPHKTAPSEA